jgi:hypothetical protein
MSNQPPIKKIPLSVYVFTIVIAVGLTWSIMDPASFSDWDLFFSFIGWGLMIWVLVSLFATRGES